MPPADELPNNKC